MCLCLFTCVQHVDTHAHTPHQELPDVWLVNVYTPNSGEGLKRLDYRIQRWDKALADYIKVGTGP